MKQTSGTIHSNRGLPRITGSNPSTKLRLVGLGLTILFGSFLIIWVTHTTWERVDRLQRQFAALKAESFYLGVKMHNGIQRLDQTLIRYRDRHDPVDYEVFLTDAHALTQWFEASRTNAATSLEREFFVRVGTAYSEYLAESRKLLDASPRWYEFLLKPLAFPENYNKVHTQSQHLLDLCETFIHSQRAAFDSFLKESQNTLVVFQRLLKLSLALLLGLASALVVLVYRGMIAPLRHRLTESQAIIARQEKLASLGVLAAGVAHEIRNPLTAIKLRLFSLKKSMRVAMAENEDALVIGNEISRLERIVKDFLQFARPSEPELVTIPAQKVLQEVHDLLKPELQKVGIQLTLAPSEPAWVRMDTQQIKQVLINLVRNSADSIGRDGTIALSVHDESGQNHKAKKSTIVMEVADSGRGIPPEVQKRLFDPFFTTKEGGTGLGLPIAARIVEKHGGELRYHTLLDRGTTFTILLPRVGKNET